MRVQSRRRAREAAMRILYEVDLSFAHPNAVLPTSLAEADLSPDLALYAEKIVLGFWADRERLDAAIAARVSEYDYSRVAAVDRNVLRVAAYELFHEPALPPAVAIDEAIEIARRYSTAESGRFVNGVLGKLLLDSPKAHWDRATAPAEEFAEAPAPTEPEPEIEEVADEAEIEGLPRIGAWKIRIDPPQHG